MKLFPLVLLVSVGQGAVVHASECLSMLESAAIGLRAMTEPRPLCGKAC